MESLDPTPRLSEVLGVLGMTAVELPTLSVPPTQLAGL